MTVQIQKIQFNREASHNSGRYCGIFGGLSEHPSLFSIYKINSNFRLTRFVGDDAGGPRLP
jgi:hypothetical protein